MNAMLPRRTGLALLAAVALPVWAQTDAAVGFRTLSAPASHRGGSIRVALWYPAQAGTGTGAAIGRNAVFAGTPAFEGASVAPGRLPLVLLSHGGLRAAPHTGGWIAAALARRGFVVAAPLPAGAPPETAGAALPEIWLRPADLSAALTALAGDAEWAARIDMACVSALGVLLGGTAALALAGARIDPARFARACDDGADGFDCAAFAREGVSLDRVEPARLAASHRDDRVRAVVAVAPEFAAAFDPTSLSAVAAPVRLIRLGGLEVAPLPAIAGLSHAALEGATPFASFGACTPRGAAILREAGEPPALCEVPDREALHARLIDLILPGLR